MLLAMWQEINIIDQLFNIRIDFLCLQHYWRQYRSYYGSLDHLLVHRTFSPDNHRDPAVEQIDDGSGAPDLVATTNLESRDERNQLNRSGTERVNENPASTRELESFQSQCDFLTQSGTIGLESDFRKEKKAILDRKYLKIYELD